MLRPGLSVALSTVCLHSWLLSEQQMKSELGKHLINTKLFRSHIFPLSVTQIKTPWTILQLWVVVSPFHQWHLKYQHYIFCYLYLVETWWINLKMWASLQKSAWCSSVLWECWQESEYEEKFKAASLTSQHFSLSEELSMKCTLPHLCHECRWFW